jgi:hypothetical protein
LGGVIGYGIQSLIRNISYGLRISVGVPDEMINNPSMGHDGYHNDPGPLTTYSIPESEIVNFTGSNADLTFYSAGKQLFRVSSPGRQFGSWWTTEPPQGELQWRINQAVPPEWGNTAERVSVLTVPEGQSLGGLSGDASYQGGIYVGRNNQVYIPRVPAAWVKTFDFVEFLRLWR